MLILLIIRWPRQIDILLYDLLSQPSYPLLSLFDVNHGPLSENLGLTDPLFIYRRPLLALLNDQGIFNDLQLLALSLELPLDHLYLRLHLTNLLLMVPL